MSLFNVSYDAIVSCFILDMKCACVSIPCYAIWFLIFVWMLLWWSKNIIMVQKTQILYLGSPKSNLNGFFFHIIVLSIIMLYKLLVYDIMCTQIFNCL